MHAIDAGQALAGIGNLKRHLNADSFISTDFSCSSTPTMHTLAPATNTCEPLFRPINTHYFACDVAYGLVQDCMGSHTPRSRQRQRWRALDCIHIRLPWL